MCRYIIPNFFVGCYLVSVFPFSSAPPSPFEAQKKVEPASSTSCSFMVCVSVFLVPSLSSRTSAAFLVRFSGCFGYSLQVVAASPGIAAAAHLEKWGSVQAVENLSPHPLVKVSLFESGKP